MVFALGLTLPLDKLETFKQNVKQAHFPYNLTGAWEIKEIETWWENSNCGRSKMWLLLQSIKVNSDCKKRIQTRYRTNF